MSAKQKRALKPAWRRPANGAPTRCGRFAINSNAPPKTAWRSPALKPGADQPSQEDIENKLSKLKAERERLGGVNLRAEEEAETLETEIGNLSSEREDLIEAINRLRQGISSLNREGRKRLLDAFDEVNGHFQSLFETLFGGGSAELQLVESDDPLESGLEIVAQPPGKKTASPDLAFRR